jgi:putative transposase
VVEVRRTVNPEGVESELSDTKMSTYTQILYHIVFSTKNRERTLSADRRPELYKYIWGVIQNKDSHLYRINGVEDHIHILSSLHPSSALSDFVKDIKVSSSSWIKNHQVFSHFTHWQDGYGAFSLSIKEKDALIEYIKDQEEHHRQVLFQEEFKKLLTDAGIDFDERYLVCQSVRPLQGRWELRRDHGFRFGAVAPYFTRGYSHLTALGVRRNNFYESL